MKKLIFFLLVNSCLPSPLPQSPTWFGSAWIYRKMITVPKRNIQAAFPLPIDLSSDTDVAAHTRSDCFDIVFTLADGVTQYAYDRDTCTAKTKLFWIAQSGISSSTDLVLYVYFGNASSTDQSAPSTVWAAYENIYHLSVANPYVDSSGNGRTCTVGTGTPGQITSQFGGAIHFDRNTYITCPTNGSFTAYTIEVLMKGDAPAGNGQNGYPLFVSSVAGVLWDYAVGGFYQYPAGDLVRATLPMNFPYVRWATANRPYYFMGTWDGSTVTFYWNGIKYGTQSVSSIGTPSTVILGGNSYTGSPTCSVAQNCFGGTIDEVRVRSSIPTNPDGYAASSAQALLYPNTMVSIGALETNANHVPVINTFTAEQYIYSGESATLQWSISNGPSAVSINNGVGSQTSLQSGSVSVSPTSTTTYTISASNTTGSATPATFTVTVLSANQGTYIRYGGGMQAAVCGYTSTTPPAIQPCGGEVPNFRPGDRVIAHGICTTDTTYGHFSNLNNPQVLRVSSITDAGSIFVTKNDGSSITPNGNFPSGPDPCGATFPGGIQGTGTQAMYLERVVLFPFTDNLIGDFDGASGNLARHMAISTDNGLTSLVCTSGTCVATLNFAPDINVSDYIAIYGTTAASGDLNSTTTTNPATQNDHQVTAINTSTHTVTFSTTSPDGTYTSNLACQPSSRNCVTISIYGTGHNPAWTGITGQIQTWGTSGNYTLWWDGGNSANVDFNAFPNPIQNGAWALFVDRSNTNLIAAVRYALLHLERLTGVNFPINETQLICGNGQCQWPDSFDNMATIIAIGKQYLTGGELTTVENKIFNHEYYQPQGITACNKVVFHPAFTAPSEFIATGSAQTGGDSLHIVLALSDTASNGFYVNAGIAWYQSASNYGMGLITAYNSSTKVATIALQQYTTGGVPNGTTPYYWVGAPSAGASYWILPTVTWDGTSAITGYLSHFTTTLQAADTTSGYGDAIYPSTDGPIYRWDPGFGGFFYGYVTHITDDTHLTIKTAHFTFQHLDLITPTPIYWIHHWVSGDCGFYWFFDHSSAGLYQPNQLNGYTNGDHDSFFSFRPIPLNNKGSVLWTLNTKLGMSLAVEDSRARTQLENWSSIMLNGQWGGYISEVSGVFQDSTGYSLGNDNIQVVNFTEYMRNSFPTYPSLIGDAQWMKNIINQKLYVLYPDNRISTDYPGPLGALYHTLYGGDATSNYQIIPPNTHGTGIPGSGSTAVDNYLTDSFTEYFPTNTLTKALINLLSVNNITWSGNYITRHDYRVAGTDYTTVLSPQKVWNVSGNNLCASILGWDCWSTSKSHGDTAISTTGGYGVKTATQVWYQARPISAGGYDMMSPGNLDIYKVGHLLGCGDNLSGIYLQGGIALELCDSVLFGTASSGANQYALGYGNQSYWTDVGISRWASFGNGDAGDTSGRIAYWMSDQADAYYGLIAKRQVEHVIHFKTNEEDIIRIYDIDNSNAPNSIRVAIHYPQNGETGATFDAPSYTEGQTTCPGSSDCSALNTTRIVQELESGTGPDSNPQRNYGLITKFLSAGTDFVQWDGTTYPNTRNHSYRVSWCAGASCSATSTGFNGAIIHKVATTLSDTTLSITPYTVTANWYGAKLTNHAFLVARNGQLRSDPPNVAVNAGDFMAVNMIPGIYTLSGAASGTVTVADNDNTLYVPVVSSGTLTITSGTTGCVITTTTLPDSTVQVSYFQQLASSGCTAPLTWTVIVGSLPSGQSLSTSGLISGVVPSAGGATFTVQLVDSASHTVTQVLSETTDALGNPPSVTACPPFPSNNVWRTPINTLPLDINSASYINAIGSSSHLRYNQSMYINTVPLAQPLVTMNFTDTSDSDPGPYPYPLTAVIEAGTDEHVSVVNTGSCGLWETWLSVANSDGSWSPNNGATWDMTSNALRAAGLTSADSAGLPIYPGIIRYEEVNAGLIAHALRFSAPQTQSSPTGYVWPARHHGNTADNTKPPMGTRVRLKAIFDISSFPSDVQVILTALKTYGMFVSDNGLAWAMDIELDPRWNIANLNTLLTVNGSNFEVVNESGLIIDPNSGAVGNPLAGSELGGKDTTAGKVIIH